MLHNLGLRPSRVLKLHNVADGINAVRMVLPRCWFDATKCAAGIRALRNYRREWNENAQTWRSQPVHDFASHGADSFRYLCLGVREEVARPLAEPEWRSQYEGTGASLDVRPPRGRHQPPLIIVVGRHLFRCPFQSK